MKIVITGANGYIGRRLAERALQRGHCVVAASRRPLQQVGISWTPWDIALAKSVQLPGDATAVIHLAANTSSDPRISDLAEIKAAEGLISAATSAGAKFIFVSSQTARQDAPTTYGRIKWRIECSTLAAHGWVIRPGQVYGGAMQGLFGQLANLVQRLPAIPAFLPAPTVQPIHIDDLVDSLLLLVERDDIPSRIISLGEPRPVQFSTFLSQLAKSRLRRFKVVIPIPRAAIRILGALMGKVRSDALGLTRLQSLFDLPTMATADDLEQLGIHLRPLRSGMHPSGNDRRRRLLKEGLALTSYVFKSTPAPSVLRRYVRAVEALANGIPLELPAITYKLPLTIGLIEDRGRMHSTGEFRGLSWRIDVATLLAEATPAGAANTLVVGKRQGFAWCCLNIAGNLLAEVIMRFFRLTLRWKIGRWSKNLPAIR